MNAFNIKYMIVLLSVGLIVNVQAMTIEKKEPTSVDGAQSKAKPMDDDKAPKVSGGQESKVLSVHDCIEDHLQKANGYARYVSALHLAARYGHDACVKTILEEYYIQKYRVVISEREYHEMMDSARRNGHDALLRAIYEDYKNGVNLPGSDNFREYTRFNEEYGTPGSIIGDRLDISSYKTPLHEAAVGGHPGCVKLLAPKGYVNTGQSTPLDRALHGWMCMKEFPHSYPGKTDADFAACIHHLLSNGAKYDVRQFNQSALALFKPCLEAYKKSQAAKSADAE